MIEIIKEYEKQKLLKQLIEESGLSVHFTSIEELIDSLTKLRNISKSQENKNQTKINLLYEDWIKENKKTFNLIEKYFTKKEEFKQKTEKLQQFPTTEIELAERKKYINDMLYKISNTLHNAIVSKEDFDKKKTLADFGYTYDSACALIESFGLEPILTAEDIASFNPNADKSFESFDDLVAVHITSFIPNESIKTSHSATKKDTLQRFLSYSTTPNNNQIEDIIQLGKTTYHVPYQPFRNTIHFCINSPVDGGFFGSSDWEKMKYAVICPFNDIAPQIKATVPQDTYISGDYNFTNNTVILCPANEKTEMQKKNPTARIVCYDSEKQPEPTTDFSGTHQTVASAHLFAPFVISNILGYKYLKTHPHYGFVDEKETEKFKKLTIAAGYEYSMHTHTSDHKKEEDRWKIYKNAVLLSIIEKEKLDFNSIQKDFFSFYFQNTDDSLVEETLDFLKPELGPAKFKKFVETIKALNKETSKLADMSQYDRKFDNLKSIVEQYTQQSTSQPNM